jgi:hypothetical protein
VLNSPGASVCAPCRFRTWRWSSPPARVSWRPRPRPIGGAAKAGRATVRAGPGRHRGQRRRRGDRHRRHGQHPGQEGQCILLGAERGRHVQVHADQRRRHAARHARRGRRVQRRRGAQRGLHAWHDDRNRRQHLGLFLDDHPGRRPAGRSVQVQRLPGRLFLPRRHLDQPGRVGPRRLVGDRRDHLGGLHVQLHHRGGEAGRGHPDPPRLRGGRPPPVLEAGRRGVWLGQQGRRRRRGGQRLLSPVQRPGGSRVGT